MSQRNYSDEAQRIVSAVGGKGNIAYLQHCATRLRFSIKDHGAVDLDTLKKEHGILGYQWSNGELQLIIGPHVADLYLALTPYVENMSEIDAASNTDNEKHAGFHPGRIIEFVTSCVLPVLPIIFGASFVKIVVLLMDMADRGVGSGTYQVLTFVGDAGFYFLPIFIGGFTAKVCHANMALGMLVGAIMVHPTLIAAVTDATPLDIYGLPITLVNYSSSFLPALVSVWIMSYIQRFIGSHSPAAVRSIVEPFFTILIMLPIALCVIGPLGSLLGQFLGDAVIWLYNTFGFVAVALMAAIVPLVISSGMHLTLVVYAVTLIAEHGQESLVFVTGIIATFCLGAATLGVVIKTKDADIRSSALAACIAATVGGISEPALFGVALRFKTPLYASMIGGSVGGAIAGIGHATAYAILSSSIWNLVGFLPGGMGNFLWELAAVVVGFAITLAVTLTLYRDEGAEPSTSEAVDAQRRTSLISSRRYAWEARASCLRIGWKSARARLSSSRDPNRIPRKR